ncbi:unknown [Clostridium sp. CAG:448]|nr:unknown [Clostridium sp. CAG:448]
MPVVGHLEQCLGRADRVGLPDRSDRLPKRASDNAELPGAAQALPGFVGDVDQVLFRQHRRVGRHREGHFPYRLSAAVEADAEYKVTAQPPDPDRCLHRALFGVADVQGNAAGAADRDGRVVVFVKDLKGKRGECLAEGAADCRCALDQSRIEHHAQVRNVLGQIADGIRTPLGAHAQNEAHIPQVVFLNQGFCPTDQPQHRTGSGTGAVGVKAAVECVHAGLDQIRIALVQRGNRNAHVLEQVGAVRVTVAEQNLAQNHFDVVILPAKRHRVGHNLPEPALHRHHRQTDLNQLVQIRFAESGCLQCGKETLGVYAFSLMIQNAVARGEIGCAVGLQRGKASPDFGTDGTAHAGNVIIVAEAPGERRIDAALKVLTHNGVFAGRVVAVADKAGKQVVGGEVLSVFLRHIQPEHLQIQVIVGQHGVNHFPFERHFQRHLDALKRGAHGSNHGFSQKTAVQFIKVGFVIQHKPISFSFYSDLCRTEHQYSIPVLNLQRFPAKKAKK